MLRTNTFATVSEGRSLGVEDEHICQKSCHRIAQGIVWMFVVVVCLFVCFIAFLLLVLVVVVFVCCCFVLCLGGLGR